MGELLKDIPMDDPAKYSNPGARAKMAIFSWVIPRDLLKQFIHSVVMLHCYTTALKHKYKADDMILF